MLIYNFTRIFKLRGIDKPFSYMVKNGYSANFATRIANNRLERLHLGEIEKLCLLFKCTPNDLYEWIPASTDVADSNHPLFPIRRTNKVASLTHILSSIPLDRLDEIEIMIKKEIEK